MSRNMYISMWSIYGVAVGLAFIASGTVGVWVAIAGACLLGLASSLFFRGRRRSQS